MATVPPDVAVMVLVTVPMDAGVKATKAVAVGWLTLRLWL